VIQQGYLQIQNAFALGSPTSGTIVSNNASLLLQGSFGVTNEALTLGGTPFNVDYGTLDTEGSSTNYWTGPIILNADTSITPYSSSGELHLSGAISGPGGFTQGAPDGTGSGILYLEGSAANTFAGDVTVNQTSKLYLNKSFFDGAIPHNLTINGVTRYLSGNQIQNVASAVVINAGGLWDMNGNIEAIGSLAGSGVMSNSGAIFHAGFNNTSTLFSGEIRGVGQLQKEGTGTMTLTGPNTYTGPTLVNSGILIVNGSQPQSRVTVSTIGTLGGTGTVGTILCNGTLSPGASPGILTSSNLTFSATGDYLVELTGTTPGSGHDQVNVRGTNNLANATLNVTTSFPPSKPSIGDQFVIINNDGAEAITGTFNGLPNNATFTVGDLGFRINYNGGDGNDVVLTVLNAPGASVTINNTDRGWYDSTGTHNAGNLNYAVGKTGFSNGFHNWFVFNVPQFAGTIVQAELLVNAYTNTSPNAQETYVLRNVSTPIATLVVGGSGLTNIYDDLADGPVYSVRDLQKVEAGQRAIIPLNLTFINDATAAAGGQIALGGSLTKPDTTSNLEQTCFGFSSLSSAPDVQLRLTFGTSTVVNATTRGWYDQTGSHSPANLNYVAGESGGSTFRNFFLFGLPSWSGNLAAAELSLNSYTNLSPTGFLNYQLHDVATPITTLTNTASGATSTFADLADGGDYGGRDIFVAEQGTRISVPLHNGFIGAATANQGGQIALGGSIANLDATPSNEHLFFFSNLNLPTDAQLWLGFVPATLPSSSFAAGSPTPLGGNSYQFVLSGTSGTTNEIQTSTDFVNWDVARTLYMTNANTTFNYTNSFPSRFFRARLVQ
jgi:autotransporter-associated beta strand protein